MGISLSEFSWEIDLTDELRGLSGAKKAQAKREIGEFLLESILRDTASATSPVDGSSFPRLSAAYKRIKGSSKADLRLRGDMLGSLNNRNTSAGVIIEITKKKQILKAFNHNTGDTLPERQFLPDEDLGEFFKSSTMAGVEKILDSFRSTETRVKSGN